MPDDGIGIGLLKEMSFSSIGRCFDKFSGNVSIFLRFLDNSLLYSTHILHHEGVVSFSLQPYSTLDSLTALVDARAITLGHLFVG